MFWWLFFKLLYERSYRIIQKGYFDSYQAIQQGMKLYETIKLSNRALFFRRASYAQVSVAKRKFRIPFSMKFSNMRLENDAYNVFMAFI